MMMLTDPTPYADINELIELLSSEMQKILSKKLVGLYLYGSLIIGDFAALWAQKEFPEWSSSIQNALLWREDWRNEQVNYDETVPETLRFVRFAISQFENGSDVSKLVLLT